MSDAADMELAIYKTAAGMAQSGSSSPEIKAAIVEMGVAEDKADIIVQEVTQYHTRYKRDPGSSGGIIAGVLWLIGGIVATAATDGHMLFYGAIIVGIIKIIIGIAR